MIAVRESKQLDIQTKKSNDAILFSLFSKE